VTFTDVYCGLCTKGPFSLEEQGGNAARRKEPVVNGVLAAKCVRAGP